MNSVWPEKSEIGIWYKKVEFELDRFIFVAPKPIPEEEWTRLCEQYGQHQTRVLAGDALLIDLRGNEPTFGSVPLDYKPPEVGTYGSGRNWLSDQLPSTSAAWQETQSSAAIQDSSRSLARTAGC
jgi:hypothetical protein